MDCRGRWPRDVPAQRGTSRRPTRKANQWAQDPSYPRDRGLTIVRSSGPGGLRSPGGRWVPLVSCPPVRDSPGPCTGGQDTSGTRKGGKSAVAGGDFAILLSLGRKSEGPPAAVGAWLGLPRVSRFL